MISTILWLMGAVIILWQLTMAIRQTGRFAPFSAVFMVVPLACVTGATLFHQAFSSVIWSIFSLVWAVCYVTLLVSVLWIMWRRP